MNSLKRFGKFACPNVSFTKKITDIYSTSIDYDLTAKATKDFFAKVQNKMYFAIHGHTAAELIMERADATKSHMGLTSWQDSPYGKIIRTDVSIAKNYLSEGELQSLGRIFPATSTLRKTAPSGIFR